MIRRVQRLLAACFLAALAGCASLPQTVERAPSNAPADTAGTRLGRAVGAAAAAHPGLSGIHVLDAPRDAFAARVLLARAAERTLDVQYYIWRADTTGTLLCEALWEAAERGVRVRVLVDDGNTKGLDEAIAVLDAHRNIEVRLFNPFANRSRRIADFVSDFARVNRRMHNKSFTADNQVAIVGGRNIGDEYFGVAGSVAFADLDLMVAGPVVPEVSKEFDAYWNSASAYPAAALLAAPDAAASANVREKWAGVGESDAAAKYIEAVRGTSLVTELLRGRLAWEWARARVVSDDPAKVLSPPERHDMHMLPLLESALGKPQREMDLVSPYFVPAKDGTAALLALVQRGVKVRILTNSLAATDVSPVHAGYSKYRLELLQGGVQLYELKPTGPEKKTDDGGGSDASLHAKTFAVDRSRIFVGSFNLDPRSARLNTELGVVVDSAPVASRLAEAFDRVVAQVAYEVRIAPNATLEWVERTPSGVQVHASEPGASLLLRAWIGFLGWLPIEWLL